MHHVRVRVWRFVPLLAALWSIGCSGADEPETSAPPETKGSGSAVLTERARVLDDASLGALKSVSAQADVTELAFSSSTAQISALIPGDVLIVGTSPQTPYGGLFAVEKIEGLVVHARRARLAEAFQDLKVDLEAILEKPIQTTGTLGKRPMTIGQSRQAIGLSFPLNLSEDSGPNRIALNGSLSVDSSMALSLDFDVTSFKLQELSMSLKGQETFQASLSAQGQSSIDKSIRLGSIAFTPITLILPIPAPPGTVPVVLTPSVLLEAGVKGSVQGEIQASVNQNAGFTAGLGYKDGQFGGFSDDTSTFDVEQPIYQAGASVKAWAGPRLEVLLYGAVGPFAKAEAFVELAANVEGPPACVTGVVNAGLTAKVGVDFLADYETTLFNHRHELAKFDTCTNDPTAPRPAITWARAYARTGSPGEHSNAVVEAGDGTYFVVGESSLFESVTGFAASMWAMRVDALGNVIWQRAFNRTQQGLARAAAVVPSGFLVAGTSGVMKLDSGGNLMWAKSYATDPLIEITSIAAHADGSFVVAGFTGVDARAWAMELDANGNELWSRRYGGKALTRVRVTSDGGYIVVGELAASADAAVMKLDSSGNVLWARAVDNRYNAASADTEPQIVSAGDGAFDIAEKPGGGFVLVGESYGNFPIPEPAAGGYYATWVAELDAQGSLTSSTVHRAPSDSLYGGAYAVAVRPNGSSVVVGRRADASHQLLSGEDILMIQDGTFSTFGGGGNDAVYNSTLTGPGRGVPLQLTSDGGLILTATSNSFNGQDQLWLIKMNRTGGINFPYRNDVSGSSYRSEHSSSTSLMPSVEEVPITVTTFTSEVKSETTPVVVTSQTP